MKNFVIKILTFNIPLIFFALISIGYYHFSNAKLESKFKMIGDFDCLIMGDSQMQRINTKLLDCKAYNLASQGEHFYFTHNKILKILNNEEHSVKKIVLGVSLHSFSPVFNKLYNVELPEGRKSLERNFYYIDHLYDNDFVKFTKLPLKNAMIGIYQRPILDGFMESIKSDPNPNIINTTLDMHYSYSLSEKKFCESQKKYLELIEDLCLKKGVELIICSTPYHQDYLKQVKKEYFSFFHNVMENLNISYHVNFISEIPKNNWMSDANHLNRDGATIYTKKLNEIILNHQ